MSYGLGESYLVGELGKRLGMWVWFSFFRVFRFV